MLRRRNLLKRVMPILLSLAMMLQSVPITAMAAELPVAATVEEADAATEPAEETEATVESTEETGAAEDADAAESAAQPEEDATVDDAAAEDGVKSDETTENTEEQPDAVAEEDGVKSDDAAEDSESKPETVKKPVAETETEITADAADAQKAGAAKIVVNDTDVWDGVGEGPGYITRKLGETGLVFFAEYAEKSRVDELQEAIKNWIDIVVDDEPVDELKNNLTYTWKDEKGAQLVDAVPVNAGTYELTIALDIAGTNGLCKSVEPADGVKLTLTIEKARVELWIDTWMQPGKTVGDLIDKNNENYQIVYADRKDDNGDPLYTVSRDIIDIADKKLPMHIFEIDESGARQEKQAEDKFDSTKDYILTIDPIALTANAKVDYELSLDDFWKIVVGERQDTWIKFERKAVGEDLIKVYEKDKAYTIDEVTTDLFTETGAPAVYVWDDKTEKEVILEDAEPVAGWYTRIQLNAGESYELDEDAGEFQYDWEPEYVYKPMKADPVDAGEYYIVWNYAGDAGAYKKSQPSEAIRFTIDPAPVVINIDLDNVEYTEEKGAKLGFADGMTAEDVNKTLATIVYGVYPIVENAEGVPEIGKEKVNEEPEFFGTSYGIEDTTNMTQYFVPEFILQRRPVKMTEKGGNVVDIDERTVDWKEVTGTLSVVVDKEKFGTIATDELPKDAVRANLESVEFAFRVFFTGNKVVYEKDGTKRDFGDVPVTDVTTNAANRNYLADITKARLEDSAVLVDVASAEDVTINTDAIVEAFVTDNQDSLYPQPAEGADDPHKGTMPEPAVKIYDQNGLFANRASYKKAEVLKLAENGEPGETTGIEGTNEKLTYTWSYITLNQYEDYLKTWDEVQRQYKDFDEYYFGTYEYLGWTDVEDGSLINPKSVGVYRLNVKFDDTDCEYRSAEAEVFFKVEAQEVIVVPTAVQYAGKDSYISDFKDDIAYKLENRKDYIIYKLPHNSMEEYNALTEETKKDYELPAEEALALYETKYGKEFSTKIVIGWDNWKVLRKEKNSEGKDTEVWVEVEFDEYTKFDDDYTYGIAANWDGFGFELNNGEVGPFGEASGNNYTTLDVKTYRTTGEEKHHESVGDVKFYDGKIYVEVDKEKIEALGHEYDGTAEKVSLEEVAKAITLYTDEELTASSKLPATVINTTDEYDPSKINIYWLKDGYRYENKNAVYGGTYSLVLRFEGGELTTAPAGFYAPLNDYGWWYSEYEDYDYDNDDDDDVAKFTVTPRAITITPELLSADLLKAGDLADKLITGDLALDENIVENDKKFFTYVELAEGGFDVIWAGKNADGTDKEGSAYEYNVGKNGGYPAFRGATEYVIQVDGRDIKEPDETYLRFGSTYTVKLKNELVSPLKESYRVTYAPADVTVEKRGNAEVVGIGSNLSTDRLVFNFSETTNDGAGEYTVMPRGAVKFGQKLTVYDRYGKEKILENTNILGFRIYAPKEFWTDPDFIDWEKGDRSLRKDKFVYQNAIWNAGGYFYGNNGGDKDGNGILDFDETTDWNNRYIDVVFPLTKDNVDRSFSITWEDGYTETFKLADVVLEEDLTKAVAPKSMAFNGVATKMAVGERQQLNLKITKAQLGDVIAVRYRIKGSEETKNDYISLDPETGVVTGLKAGKVATQIEAYAVYKDAKGNFVPVVDSKGKEKVATTKITVTEVTASTIKKIVAQGESAKLYYTVPDNGYRREIYVVDVTKGTGNEAAKKWKPAKFNEEIAKISNGDWETAGFAREPIYSYVKNEDLYGKELAGTYDSKLKAHIETIGRLKAEHEYVIYVRNVSAARALDDGSVVALSASGAVKKVKTIKSQVKSLDLDFTIKTDENDKKNTVTHPVNTDGTVATNKWTVELSAKKAQLNVYGRFSDMDDAAEQADRRRYPLVPTSKDKAVKDALKKYQIPKLEYVILDDLNGRPFTPGLKQSKYATISKKGLISLKGVDLNGETTVYIYVRDNMQHQEVGNQFTADASISLTITAKATSVTGKKVKAVVGQSIRLADCLTYKDGKKTLPNYRSGNIQITPEMKNAAKVAGYDIVDRGERDGKNNRTVHDWYITALWPNKNKFELKVTAFDVLDGNGNPMVATIPLTSKQMDPVKGLKVTYVDDKNITINFTHAANKNEADNGRVYEYAFEIKDARGNVVEKKILKEPNLFNSCDIVNAKQLKSAQSWIQYKTMTIVTDKLKDNEIRMSGSSTAQFNYYTGANAKVKTFAYTYTNPELVRLSSYTISVTPLYGNQKADKAATTKTKTTNIPASYRNPDLTGAVPDRRGGTGVGITATNSRQENKNKNEAQPWYVSINEESAYPFVSGNIYTLRINNDLNGDVPRDRVSDTLTWKSSNTKVATIKANAGTYTATFKPVNQGETTITITSKITKKVIARHAVKVVAVRDGAGYGGDYEPTWDEGFYENILALYDPYYDGVVEVLSMNVPLTIKQRTWVSFTAPHFGYYTFSEPVDTFYDSKDGRDIGGTNVDSWEDENDVTHVNYGINLEEGQKVYFQATNTTLTVAGSEYARLTQANTKDNPLEVKGGCVSFTAWEDNAYTFWLNGTKVVQYNEDGESYTEDHMKAGETHHIWVEDGKMYVTWREQVAAALTTPVNVTLDKDNQARYVTYTANVAGEYAFKYVIPVEGVTCAINPVNRDVLNLVNSTSSVKDGNEEVINNYYLEEGQKVVVEFKAEPEITDAAKTLSASVTVTAQARRKVENGTITIPKGTTEIVEYVIPAFTTEKAKFKFDVEDGGVIERYLDKDYKNLAKMEVPEWMAEQGVTLALSDDTLTASKKNWPELKSGDSIYIEVTATGNPEDENVKDAVLKVTQVLVETLALGTKDKEITNDTEQWYTFTAPKDGFYEFDVTVADRADGGVKHDASLALYKELFGNANFESAPAILDLKSGETLAIKLTPESVVPDNDGEVVKSTATVSVKELVPTPLKLGKDKAEPVKIAKTSKEVKYYSFTAAVEADYTIAWQPTDKDKADNAEVTIFVSDLMGSSYPSTRWGGRLGVGGIKYIKVEVSDTSEGAADVDGTLCVTSDNLSATVLPEGESRNYDLGGEDGPNVQVFKFTAPKAGRYAVVTTVAKIPDSEESYPNPTIIEGYEMPYDIAWFEKGETQYFTLFSGVETKGTILVRFVEEEVAGDQKEVSVANGVTNEYTFKITESGRYEFKADYDKEKADVLVGGYMQLADASGRYYLKNAEVKIFVTGKNVEANATAAVKLYKPEKIKPEVLKVGENTIDVNAGGTKYYEISVTDPKELEFNLSDMPEDTLSPTMSYFDDNKNKNLENPLYDGRLVSVEKNGKLFIKIKSNDDEKKLNCKLNISERTELKVGDNTVELKAEETKPLIFRAPETGYYSFRVNQTGAELSFEGQTGEKLYDIQKLSAKQPRTYYVTNTGATDLTLTVKMAVETPIEVTPGSKTTAKTIPAGEVAYYALKTFKSADYLIKIADTSKGEDLVITGVDGTQESIADVITISSWLDDETMLRVRNKGAKETSVTVELTADEAQPLTADAITLKKNESKLISFVAPDDNRYLINKDNDKVTMTQVKLQHYGWTDTEEVEVSGAYKEMLLYKAEKLVYRLEYKSDDEKAAAEQTVNVKIAPIVPTEMAAESTPITIDEKGNTSLWYQFTAKEDAAYTFSLEDEYENEVQKLRFYSYMTKEYGESWPTERFMKTGEKLIINLTNLEKDSKYTLKYKAVKAITENGTYTMDFEYKDEVQELKFVVPKAGTYKISAAAFRGNFEVAGYVGTKQAMSTIYNLPSNVTTYLLNKDDVVTFKVTAQSSGKSSVSLRIAEDSAAETMTVGTEYTGVSSKENAIYYEIRIAETALYAISAGGAPQVSYYVNDAIGKFVNNVEYEKLYKDDRVIIKVDKVASYETEAEYAVKIDRVTSLDSNDTADKALAATAGETDYVFTKANAYVKFTAPDAGDYYIAVQPEVYGSMNAAIAPNPNGMGTVTLAKNAAVTFTFTNYSVTPESDDESSKDTTVAFRLTIKKAGDLGEIKVGDTKTGTLAADQSVSFTFKAAKKATYVINFKPSGCNLGAYGDGYELNLDKDQSETLTVSATGAKTGRYELSVTELVREPLTLGVTASKTLKTGEKAYYEFASTVTTDTGEAKYQIYASGYANGSYKRVNADGVTIGSSYDVIGNNEVTLKKGEKLAITLGWDDANRNGGFKLTVKEVKSTTIAAADTVVSGSLDSRENAYYEFTSGKEKTMKYKVTLTSDFGVTVQKQVGEAAPVPASIEGTLEKGEKLLITVKNSSDKKNSYELRIDELPADEEPVEDQTETE